MRWLLAIILGFALAGCGGHNGGVLPSPFNQLNVVVAPDQGHTHYLLTQVNTWDGLDLYNMISGTPDGNGNTIVVVNVPKNVPYSITVWGLEEQPGAEISALWQATKQMQGVQGESMNVPQN